MSRQEPVANLGLICYPFQILGLTYDVKTPGGSYLVQEIGRESGNVNLAIEMRDMTRAGGRMTTEIDLEQLAMGNIIKSNKTRQRSQWQ